MVLQSFLYLLVPLNRAERTRVNYYEFLKSSTTPCRKKSPAPVNGLNGLYLKTKLASLRSLFSGTVTYVKVDGVPTNKKIVWRKLIDIKKVQAALTKLKEMNWLYTDVQPDKVEKSIDDLVIEVANNATSEMIENECFKQT